MKNIPPSALPYFHDMSTKDLDSFLFQFDILCRSYNYVNDAQKLKLFPTTLKDFALQCFMGLGEHTIRSRDEMKTTFLRKYQEYCMSKDSHNDIFKMQQQDDENREDYVERFVYNLQKSRKNALDPNAIRTIFQKGVLEDYIYMLNLMAVGDISQKPFEQIIELCRKYSLSKSKAWKGIRESKSAGGGVTQTKLENLIENYKTDILETLSSHVDSMNIKKKFEDEALTIFCSRCKKRHPLKNCPLNVVSLCGLCAEDYETNNCPSLPGL